MEKVRREKMQMREKVGKSRNIVFSQCFVAPEGRKVGSQKPGGCLAHSLPLTSSIDRFLKWLAWWRLAGWVAGKEAGSWLARAGEVAD